MDIWEIDKALLFLVLVLPGFISIKVYSLLIAVEARDYSKSLVEAICYSSLNFAALSWLIVTISSEGFSSEHPFIYWSGLLLVFVGAPSAWPFLFRWLAELKIFKKNILSPFKQPWDYVFSKRESMWIAVYMKDNEVIRGKFAEKSFASSFPSERQIYIEEVWREKNGKKFGEKIPRTKGVLISQDEIKYIKFIGK